MKAKRLNLAKLKVTSFVTDMASNDQKTVKGGTTNNTLCFTEDCAPLTELKMCFTVNVECDTLVGRLCNEP